MKLKNQILFNLDETPVMNGLEPKEGKPDTRKPLTSFDVLTSCALAPSAQQPYAAAEAAERYSLALELHKAMKAPVDEPMEVNIETVFAGKLKNDLVRIYSPIISGQMIAILESQ